MKQDNQPVTQGIFADYRIENDKKFEFIYNKFMEHDARFDRLESKLDHTIDIMQQMCDRVLRGYENFSAESAGIKFNYQELEIRVTKLEKLQPIF